MIFASCQSGVQKVEFGETSPIILEVGETYSPSLIVSPETNADDVLLSTSDSRVIVISPDGKLVAIGVGTAQIEAKLGEKTANLVVEVIEKRQKLATPVGFFFEAATNRLVWSAVNNANSYDVEINGEIVAKNLTTNFFEIGTSQGLQKVRIKANGINRFCDSDFTSVYEFKNLESPTNLKFDKTTNTLSWDYPTDDAKFRVCINKVLMNVENQKSFVLNLVEAGTYEISVVAVAPKQNGDGVVLFDSPRSQSLNIVRLDGVDKDSIVWNAAENLLTWGEVENAKYEVVIDGKSSVVAEKNNLRITDLEKGIHEIKITPISSQNLVLNATKTATSNVAITKQLSTPEIESYSSVTNKLTLKNIGEAQNFQIVCGGNIIYDGPAEIVGSKAIITLGVGVFDKAGQYELVAKAKEDAARFFTESNWSQDHVITRLSAPTRLSVENGTTLSFATLPQATFGYTIFVAGAEYETDEARFELFDLVAGSYEVKVKYLGNKSTILESDYATLTVTKLSTPVLEFDKTTLWLEVDKEQSVACGYDITINGSLQKNVWLNTVEGHKNEYSLSGMLAVGQNRITVQALPSSSNEILSNVASIDIYRLEEIANIEHCVVDDTSYIKFDTNPNYNNFVVTLNSATNLDFTIENEGGKTILELKKPTSSIFENAGEYSLFVEALSTNKNFISTQPAKIQVNKLSEPLGLTFEFPNKLLWNKFADVDNNFELVLEKDGDVVYSQTTSENEMTISDLVLGVLKAKVKVLGNRNNVLDSNYCQEIEFTHEKLSKPQNINYSDDLITWDPIVGAECYEISIGSQKFECQTNSFATQDFAVGQYQATIKAINQKDATITSDYESISFDIKRKLSAPTNLKFDKLTRTLTFDGVETAINGASAHASKYMVYVNGSPALDEKTNKTSFTFNSDAFVLVGEYEIEVQAIGGVEFINDSEKSEPLVLQKLAAPTSVSIDNEIVSCLYNSETVESVEILINGTKSDSLKNLSGEISVKARYIGKTNQLIDSEYYETTIYRLGRISDFRLNNDVISWSPVANASGYVISVKPENENLEKFYLKDNVSSYAYDFRYEGSYTVEIYAQGGEVEGKQYLDSAHESFVATKNVAPTNVQLVENPETGIVTITFDYAGEENSTSKFSIYVNGTLVGDTPTKRFQCSSALSFGAVGHYSVTVKAAGNNANNFVSSIYSSAFLTQRLQNPFFNSTFNGQNYTFRFESTSSETDYIVLIENEVTSDEGTTTKLIKREEISKSASSEHTVSFAEEMQTNQFVDGKIKVSLLAVGNNTTALRSVTTTSAYTFAPRPKLSNDADKLLIERTNDSYEVLLSYYTTDSDGNKSQEIKIDKREIRFDEYVIPNTWLPGTYTFVARQYLFDGVLSAATEHTVKRLSNVSDYSLARDEINSDIIYLSWPEVENAQGYVVYVSQDQDFSNANANAIEIYKGTETKCALPLTEIKDGAAFFFFKVLGGETAGFSSQTVWVGSNKVKLYKSGLNLRNDNGVLAWSDGFGLSKLSSGFKLVVNSEVIYLDKNTFSYPLEGYSGQLNIKLKQMGDFEHSWGLDSDYVELDIVKLPKPTNIRVVEGVIRWDHSFTLEEGQTINFVYNIGGYEFDSTTEGIANLTAMLLANKEYTASVQAKNPELFLSSDKSEEVVVKILENPNANDETANISTNPDKTISWFNWSSAVGSSKCEINIDGEKLESPIKNNIDDTKWTISGLDAGNYQISVRRIGGTGMIDGVGYLSSGFSKPIPFTVLAAPEVSMNNGEMTWLSQVGANNYYIYIGDAYKPCGNVTNWSFADEYKDFSKETEITLTMRAVGDGVNYVASVQTSEIKIVKPRPPEMPTVKSGALCWNDLGGYTYFEDTENQRVLLDFLKNGTTYESFEIDVQNLKNGWPLDDNYLQKLTSNLPAGDYTLKIKQIGDSKKVVTSEYSEQILQICIAQTPQNVFVDKHRLQWDAVSLDNYSDTNDVVYVIYAFDSTINDWIKLGETIDTSFDVENEGGLLKPQHTSLAVAVKGNTSADGMTNYVTGNMSAKIDIVVLGSTSDIQTVDGNLTWGIVANAVSYKISSDTNNMDVDGRTRSSILNGFSSGVHNIRIRALGNGTSKLNSCIINGVWGNASTFTKLSQPVVSTTTEDSNKLEWGSFRWNAVENASFGYNVYVNNKLYRKIDGTLYESDYSGTDRNAYSFQAKGNSVTPSATNIAYVSSDLSNGLARARLAKVTGVKVLDGKLYWSPASIEAMTKHYFVEFSQNGERVKRVSVEAGGQFNKNIVKINQISMVEFDVEGYVKQGLYSVCVRETSNSETYIAGIESDAIEISKLNAPNNVRLENGILSWEDVAEATGYVLRLVSDTSTIEIVEGFSFDESSNSWRWISEFETGVYNVCLRAVSSDENKLNSSWANRYGKLEDGMTQQWQVRQIPKINLSNIKVNDSGVITWEFSSTTNIPTNKAYIVWRKGEPTYQETPILKESYNVDDRLLGISIRVIPYGENEFDYFASIFSEIKDVERPEPPKGLEYDETKQIFTWMAAGTSDASYIVYYKLNGGEEIRFETQETKFEPTKLGEYVVQVAVKKSNSSVGISDKCEEVSGKFDLFNVGNGTSESPFLVDSTNFDNIMYRPNAYFKLTENIVRKNCTPLGSNGSKAPTQFLGKLDGDDKTITVAFENNQDSVFTGIFAELGDGGQIKNLNVKVEGNFVLNMSSANAIHAGAIAGSVNGTEALIENCKVFGDTTILREFNTETRFGAIAGWLKVGTIKNCVNKLNITSSTNFISKVGGIVGIIGSDSMTSGIVDACRNEGEIKGANTVGGIVAYNYGTVQNSINCAQIQSEAYCVNKLDETIKNDSIAGGIVGENRGKKTGDEVVGGLVLSCQNSGKVIASNSTGEKTINSFAGGIVGETENGKLDQNKSLGEVSNEENNSSSTKKAQAIVGNFRSYSEVSTNYKSSTLSQEIPNGVNMTIEDLT